MTRRCVVVPLPSRSFGDAPHNGDPSLELYPPSAAELLSAEAYLAGEVGFDDVVSVCLGLTRAWRVEAWVRAGKAADAADRGTD